MVGRSGVASRSVADDSLSISQMHSVGLAIRIINPVPSSLKQNCTVFAIELETKKPLIKYAIPDLDLLELCLWLADFKGGPVVC